MSHIDDAKQSGCCQSGRTDNCSGEHAQLASIFVSIPSYRDPECQYTIADLFRKAKQPERVFVGVCWQVDEDADAHCFLLDFCNHDANIRSITLHYTEARGPCFARALIEQRLLRSEDYILQLDSHYRMVEGWDEELLRQWALCPCEKPILTAYPSSYTLPDDYTPGGPDRAALHPGADPIVMCAREFAGTDGFLRVDGKSYRADEFGDHPRPSLFWAAGFAFASSSVVREVPYDINLTDLFFGEEQSMAARLWTSGWDFFSPSKVIGYHLWTRKHRPVFRELACDAQREREHASRNSVRKLYASGVCNGEGESPNSLHLGLGTARTFHDFETYCGVRFDCCAISERAMRGGMSASGFVDGCPAQQRPQKSGESAAPTVQCANVGSSPSLIGDNPMLGLMPGRASSAILAMLGSDAAMLGGGANAARRGAAASSTLATTANTSSELPPRLLKLPSDGGHAHTADGCMLRPVDIETLNSRGFLVLDNFLQDRCYSGEGLAAASTAPLIARRGAQAVPMRQAQLGRGDRRWSSAAVRGDEMAWLQLPKGGLFHRAAVHLRQQQRQQWHQQQLSKKHASDRCSVPADDCMSYGNPGAAAGCERRTNPTCAQGSISVASARELEMDVEASGQLRSAFRSSPSDNGAEEERHGMRERQAGATAAERAEEAIDEPEHYRDLDVLLVQLQALREELDACWGLKSIRASAMVARYPGAGAQYARHVDALPEHADGERRRLTAVYYLNQGWQPGDGGCLRCYFPAKVGREVPGAFNASVPVPPAGSALGADEDTKSRINNPVMPWDRAGDWALDVEPCLDRLVLFSSEWLEHAVLPAHSERFAVTMWLY